MAEERCKHCGRSLTGLEIYEQCSCKGMSDEKKEFVVVVNGQRASGLLSESEAKEEVKKRQPTQESTPAAETPKVEVKQNLFG